MRHGEDMLLAEGHGTSQRSRWGLNPGHPTPEPSLVRTSASQARIPLFFSDLRIRARCLFVYVFNSPPPEGVRWERNPSSRDNAWHTVHSVNKRWVNGGWLWPLLKQTNQLKLKITLERLHGRIPMVSAPRWSLWKLLSLLNSPSLLCLTESASIQSIISVRKWNLLKKEHKATESCIMPFISVQWPAAVLWFTELKLMICLKKKKINVHSAGRTS